jgi:hemolysin activation/secretion protein
VPLPRWNRCTLPCLAVFIALLLPVERAQSQVIQRPADERLELPEFESPEEEEPILPPIIQPLEPEEAPSAGPGVFIESYRFVGSTVFSTEELESIVAPWTGRVIRSEDLVSVRNAITEHYVRHGYVNSGATLRDQDFEGGVIEIHIVEGSLSEIQVTGNRQFSARYLRDRIRRGATTPLHVGRLEERIQILQQDPRIQKLAARLVPGDQRGQAVLHIQVEETNRFGVNLNFNNNEPPSIGALGGGFDASLQNIVGWGDTFGAEFTITEGLERYRSRYEIPFTRWDTRLVLQANYADSEVTEEPFDDLGIESTFQSYQIGLSQPVYTSAQTQFELGLIADWRRSNTKLGETSFSFPGSGADEGETTASVLRFVADWSHRDRNQVLAARVQLSWGIDALDATTHTKRDREGSAQLPDGRFVASLIQLQWARRFGSLGVQKPTRAGSIRDHFTRSAGADLARPAAHRRHRTRTFCRLRARMGSERSVQRRSRANGLDRQQPEKKKREDACERRNRPALDAAAVSQRADLLGPEHQPRRYVRRSAGQRGAVPDHLPLSMIQTVSVLRRTHCARANTPGSEPAVDQ